MPDLTQHLIVHDLAGDRALVEAPPTFQQRLLGPLGFVPAPEIGANYWIRPLSDEMERLFVARELLGWGALFAAGPGWSPSELMEHYWEHGKIDSAWRTIAWKGPEQPQIDDCTLVRRNR